MPLRLKTGFWTVLVLVVLAAAVPRFLSYNFSLPYIDHADEPNIYFWALEWRGLFQNPYYIYNYPPAYVALSAAMQVILEPLGIAGSSATIQAMRFISVIANLLTLIMIALTARRLADDLAGWIAGAAWGVAPLVIANGVYALPDPLVYLLVSTALWLAVSSWQEDKRAHRAIWSVGVGMLAALVKYPALPAIAPGLVVTLRLLRRDGRRGWRHLSLEAAIIGGTAIAFLAFNPLHFEDFGRGGGSAVVERLPQVLNLNVILNSLTNAIAPLELAAFGTLCAAGLAAYLWNRQRGRRILSGQPIALALVMAAGIIAGTAILGAAAGFDEVNVNYRLRDVLPATTVGCILLGVAAAQIRWAMPDRWRQFGTSLMMAALVALVWLPQMGADWALVRDRRLPDRRVALRQWFDINLDPGTVIVSSENHKTFNPLWGGIPYRQWVDWWVSDNILEHSVAEWRDVRGMSYAAIPRAAVEAMRDFPEGQDYLAQLLHLRDFYAPPAGRGPEMGFFRLWRMQVEVNVRFGEAIRLVGYDRSGDQARPGQSVTYRFYWTAAMQPADNYSLFIHLMPPDDGMPVAQQDGTPARLERPTLSWTNPDETLISEPVMLAIPPDLPAGQYAVRIGLYNYETGDRLPANEAGDSSLLTTLMVSD